ncbi:alpha/beta-hydrolase [Cyathus striatus]|nr:alpha/beta-hydrolase [Cyathus striatus]
MLLRLYVSWLLVTIWCYLASAAEMTTDGNLTFVSDSGVCETTPGVHQVSGYISITEDTFMWFWFFAARNNPDTAPLTLWLNGGPGCSSLLGIFQENGPCQVNSDESTTAINPYSWNNVSNMLYIDQPIGSGFSFGPNTTNTTDATAAQLWTAFQAMFDSNEFSRFQNRDLIFATESYGARYGSTYITYFNSQNALIDSGELTGHKIVFTRLMVSNGRHDPLTLARSYLQFAANAPGYGPLQNESTIAHMQDSFFADDGCQTRLQSCYAADGVSDSNHTCLNAYAHCQNTIYDLAIDGRDSDDLRQNTSASFPPTFYLKYIRTQEVMDAIGARNSFDQCSDDVRVAFGDAGEYGRSNLPVLAPLANNRFPILIWVGDADIKCNWLGIHDAMVTMDWYGNQQLNNTEYRNISISNKPVAAVKSVDNFTFARVYGAGHALPAFQPQAAVEIFSQFIQGKQLESIASKSGVRRLQAGILHSSFLLFMINYLLF